MAHTQADSQLPLAGGALLNSLADNWWLLLLRGLVAIVFGILSPSGFFCLLSQVRVQ